MTIENKDDYRLPVGKLAWGLVLLAIGTLTFLETVDLWDSGPFWTWWPLFLIGLGAAGEIDALRLRKSDGSFMMLAIGVWMLVATKNMFGLSYFEAMPLGVAVAGLFVAIHAVIDRPANATGKKENQP